MPTYGGATAQEWIDSGVTEIKGTPAGESAIIFDGSNGSIFDAEDRDALITSGTHADRSFGIGVNNTLNSEENPGEDSEVGYSDSIGDGDELSIKLPGLLVNATVEASFFYGGEDGGEKLTYELYNGATLVSKNEITARNNGSFKSKNPGLYSFAVAPGITFNEIRFIGTASDASDSSDFLIESITGEEYVEPFSDRTCFIIGGPTAEAWKMSEDDLGDLVVEKIIADPAGAEGPIEYDGTNGHVFDALDRDALIKGDEEFGIGVASAEDTDENAGADSEIGYVTSLNDSDELTIEFNTILQSCGDIITSFFYSAEAGQPEQLVYELYLGEEKVRTETATATDTGKFKRKNAGIYSLGTSKTPFDAIVFKSVDTGAEDSDPNADSSDYLVESLHVHVFDDFITPGNTGTDGNDTLTANGDALMIGGGGSDNFIVDSSGASFNSRIVDFHFEDGDQLTFQGGYPGTNGVVQNATDLNNFLDDLATDDNDSTSWGITAGGDLSLNLANGDGSVLNTLVIDNGAALVI